MDQQSTILARRRTTMALALCGAVAACMALGLPASAQTIAGKPDVTTAKPGSKWYVRGLKMNQVVKRFGQPQKKYPAVPKPGTRLNPPITRWVYPDFTVYFEHSTALHLVKHHAKTN